MDDSVSRCWWVSHSLRVVSASRKGDIAVTPHYFVKSAWPECVTLTQEDSKSRLCRLTSSSVPSMHCRDAYQLGLVFRIKGVLTMLELGVGLVTKLRRLREAT